MSKRVYNFCAGPAVLPTQVLEQAQAELLDYQGQGMSVMEMSHRGETFAAIAADAEQDLRDLLGIPDHYRVLFLQGGASLQFAQVPLNLLADGGQADYVDTGIWSRKALTEAQRFAQINVVASGRDSNYQDIPPPSEWQLSSNASYLHYCGNETIGGVQFAEPPQVSDVPLVVDMSSEILSRPIDVSRYGLIYAGAQKNIGPSGLTLVIVREDLIGHARSSCPTMMDYRVMAESGSMYNTPPTFAWYLAGLVFKWLKAEGGLAAMDEHNCAKQQLLYSFIDGSDFYNNAVAVAARSWMNVPFQLADEKLNSVFLKGAQARGLVNLKGHRSVGGMRASLYNATDLAAVQALVDYMKDFEKEHG